MIHRDVVLDPSFRIRRLWRLWRHEYDVIHSHVTSSMALLIDVQYALSCRLPIGHESLNRLVSEIFSINLRTNRHTNTAHTEYWSACRPTYSSTPPTVCTERCSTADLSYEIHGPHRWRAYHSSLAARPSADRSTYKVAVMTYKVVRGTAPRYHGTAVTCRRPTWSADTALCQ